MGRGKTRRSTKKGRTRAGTPCSSGKIRYRDRLGAEMAIASTQRSNSSRRDENRIYRCPDCQGWHLTSNGRRTW